MEYTTFDLIKSIAPFKKQLKLLNTQEFQHYSVEPLVFLMLLVYDGNVR